MSDDMNIVIVGERAVHDGLGNKLEGTKREKGHVVSQPVHTVPGYIGNILCDNDLAEMVETPAEAPPPDPAPVEPVAEIDTVEEGIKEAEAEAAPAPAE